MDRRRVARVKVRRLACGEAPERIRAAAANSQAPAAPNLAPAEAARDARYRPPRRANDGMARAPLYRLLLVLPAVWMIITIVFLLIHIVPGDPSSRCSARRAGGATAAASPRSRARPALRAQYGRYLKGLAAAIWGESYQFPRSGPAADFPALSRHAGVGSRGADRLRGHRHSRRRIQRQPPRRRQRSRTSPCSRCWASPCRISRWARC